MARKPTMTKLLSHMIKQKEEMHMTVFLIQSTRGYHRQQQRKVTLELWKIPWRCPFKVITYYGKSAFTSINLFLYNSLPSDIWFLPNESVFKRKVIKLKQWQWLGNSWLGALLAINKFTSQYPETSHLPLFIYFISFSVSCISSGAIIHSAFTLLAEN